MSRDFSKPYTQAELEILKAKFRNLPTYRPGGWVKASDIPAIVEFMEYPRTPQQVAAYQAYWETKFGGILTMEAFEESAGVLHSTSEFARDYAVKLDMNGDGRIDKDEFKDLMKMLVTHDPKLKGESFEEFVMEADLDKDGRVDIAECAKWIESKCGESTTSDSRVL